jgi:hypothetical protein
MSDSKTPYDGAGDPEPQPVPVPPYEDSPSATGLVDGEVDDAEGQPGS